MDQWSADSDGVQTFRRYGVTLMLSCMLWWLWRTVIRDRIQTTMPVDSHPCTKCPL